VNYSLLGEQETDQGVGGEKYKGPVETPEMLEDRRARLAQKKRRREMAGGLGRKGRTGVSSGLYVNQIGGTR